MPTLQRLLLAAFLLAPLALHAQPAPSKLDAILARGALRVGVTGDYRPFALLDKETGAFSGIDIDMANSLARGMGVKLELVQTAWGSLLPDLAADKFDVGMGGISVSLERQKTSFFSIPVLRTGKTPIARCENKAKFDTLAEIDQPGIRVITNPGGTNERYDRANLKAAQIIVSPQNTAIFDELVEGHADLMLTDAVETRLQAKLHPELCAIHPDAPFDFSELAYLLPRDVALKAFVDQWLHIAQETGEYQRVSAKYLN